MILSFRGHVRFTVQQPFFKTNFSDARFCTIQVLSSLDVEVDAWDWNEELPASGSLCDDVVLVIGSKLVYTQETAEACVQLLLRLRNNHPAVEIWIVQVTDRLGWWDIVVPTLENNHVVVKSIPILLQHHEMASTMVPMGGTLDRHVYGAFCIHQTMTSST